MPGTFHEGLIALLRDDPWLAFDILDVPRPKRAELLDRHTVLGLEDKRPWTIVQRVPDLVLVCRAPSSGGVALAVEVQAEARKDKHWQMPPCTDTGATSTLRASASKCASGGSRRAERRYT